MITVGGKVIMRLPTTGLKMIKTIMQTENGDICDKHDAIDT